MSHNIIYEPYWILKLGISENFAIFYDRPSPKIRNFSKILNSS